jgi:hypothetical protein
MDTLSIQRIITDGLFISVVLTIVILGSLYIHPRLWLQDYPKEIREKVPPLSHTEKRWRGVVAVLFLATMVGGLYYSAAQLKAANGGTISFLSAYLHTVIVFNIFNLFDAVVIDYLILTLMKPKFIILPGAKGMEYLFNNPRMHIANYLKGIVFCAVFSLPIAFIITR